MKDLKVTVDGDTYDVDSVEEAGCIPPGEEGTEDERIVVHVRYTDEEWIARVEDPDLGYEGRDSRKWGAIRKLIDLIDERARHFGF